MNPRNILIFSTTTILLILVLYITVPNFLLGEKPNIFLVTFGFWLEILISFLFLVSIISKKITFHVTFLGFVIFTSLVGARFLGNVTNFHISLGTNIYIQIISIVEILLSILLGYSLYRQKCDKD